MLRDDAFDDDLIVRVIVVSVAAIVAVLMVVQFVQARGRTGGPGAEGGSSALDGLVITSPDDGVFADTVVWSLPSQRATVRPVDDVPVVELDAPEVGVLVGLRSSEGIVALSLLPPGLDRRPAELLVSPTSTALAIAAMHPELMSGDTATHVATMVAISQAPSFPELAARVDGRPLASWGPQDLEPLSRVVSESRLLGAQPTCDGFELVGGAVSRCPSTSELQNVGSRTILLRDETGSPCALVPPRFAEPPTEGLDRLAEIAGRGAVGLSQQPGTVGLRPGTTDGSACGEGATIVGADRDEITDAERLSVLADLAVPLARLLGADDDLRVSSTPDAALQALLDEQEIPRDRPPTPAERAAASVRILQSPRGASAFDLLPPTAAVVEQLDDLAALFDALYP